jgi:hypothetical protein
MLRHATSSHVIWDAIVKEAKAPDDGDEYCDAHDGLHDAEAGVLWMGKEFGHHPGEARQPTEMPCEH